MRGIALALGGSADELEGEKGGDPFWVVRLIGYPGKSAAISQNNDIGWYFITKNKNHSNNYIFI